MSTSRYLIAVLVTCLLVACGGDAEPEDDVAGQAQSAPAEDAPPTQDDEPDEDTSAADVTACSLATPDMVNAAFGGTAAEGVEGAARACTFAITGGSAASVTVFHYGGSSDWDGVQETYEDNRSGTIDVAGVGEEAFNPADVGVYELVARSGDVVFGVAVLSGPDSPGIPGGIVDLATAIAANQS